MKTIFVSRAARFPKEYCFEVEYKSFKWVERFKYFGINLTNQKRLKADGNQGMLAVIQCGI